VRARILGTGTPRCRTHVLSCLASLVNPAAIRHPAVGEDLPSLGDAGGASDMIDPRTLRESRPSRVAQVG